MYGRINLNTIDTQPGCPNAFAPPKGFADDYKRFMIARVRSDPGVRQHVAYVAMKFRAGHTPPVFQGPFAAEAQTFAEPVFKKLMAPVRGAQKNKQGAEAF